MNKAKTYMQACYQWACHVEDNMGTTLNEHSHPNKSDSIELDDRWVLRNQFGTLAVIHKHSGRLCI